MIRAYIDALIAKEQEITRRLLEVEKSLEDQKKANLAVTEHFAKLEKIVRPKSPTKTFAEQAAKRSRRLAPTSKKDLVELVGSRATLPTTKAFIIKPPAGVKDPIRYLVRCYDPTKDNNSVKSVYKISNDRVIVRVGTESAAAKIRENSALKSCEFSQVKTRLPRIIIHGTNIQVSKDFCEELYSQNEAIRIRCKGDYQIFEMSAVRCWRDKGRNTYTWIVEATSTFRKFLVEEMKGRVHIGWLRVHIAKYIGATRCCKCQKYGHTIRFWTSNTDICGQGTVTPLRSVPT